MMNYSKNTKTYGRKEIRKNKRRNFIAWCILFLIGLSVGCVIVSGFMHIFCCLNVTSAEAVEVEVTSTAVQEPEPISLGEYKLTAYCACEKCCGKTDGITASGVRAKQGVTIAADTNILPFGTKVLINDNEYIVQDKGGAIKGKRIDIYFDHHQDALEFGVQYKEIFIMKEGEKYEQV